MSCGFSAIVVTLGCQPFVYHNYFKIYCVGWQPFKKNCPLIVIGLECPFYRIDKQRVTSNV